MKDGPAAKFGFRGYLAAVQTRKVFHDRKAEPGTAYLAGAAAVEAVKALEYASKVFRDYSLACVGNRDHRPLLVFFKGHVNGASRPVEFDRIVDQVNEHLLQA